MQSLLRARYALHLLKFEQEPEPKSQKITYPFAEFREILNDIRKLLASQAAKNDISLEPTFLVEPDILDEPKPEVVADLVPLQKIFPSWPIEVKEPLVEIFVNLPAEFIMDLLPSSPAIRVPLSLRLPDTYDPLQIFLQQTGSHEIKLLMVQSTIDSVFSGDDLPRHVAYILLGYH